MTIAYSVAAKRKMLVVASEIVDLLPASRAPPRTEAKAAMRVGGHHKNALHLAGEQLSDRSLTRGVARHPSGGRPPCFRNRKQRQSQI